MKTGPGSETRNAPGLVLVVEDEFWIAMELGAILADAGHEVLGPAANVETALVLIEERRPSAAVLDVNLAGERVTLVAQALMSKNVPFVLTTAYSPEDLANEPLLARAVKLPKPTSPARLLKEVDRMLTAGRAEADPR